MKKVVKVRVDLASLEQVKGETFVEARLTDVEKWDQEREGTEELVLHFSNGKEISIYFCHGEIVVEGD